IGAPTPGSIPGGGAVVDYFLAGAVQTVGRLVERRDNRAPEGNDRSDDHRDGDDGHDQAVLGQRLTFLVPGLRLDALQRHQHSQNQILQHYLPPWNETNAPAESCRADYMQGFTTGDCPRPALVVGRFIGCPLSMPLTS